MHPLPICERLTASAAFAPALPSGGVAHARPPWPRIMT